MSLFPQSFIDDLRTQADILSVVQDYVSLKKVGATYKGLCPFHSEKTPSFHVNREKGFFHCFGCGVGGDVFKFLELQERMSFPDAVRHLAQRFGLSVPETESSAHVRGETVLRETLLKMHEAAAAYFREQLRASEGRDAARQLKERGLTTETIDKLGLGFAPRSRDALTTMLLRAGFEKGLLLASGLVAERDAGVLVDRFRGRLMIPICRDSGSVIAFGGRAMEPGQEPKYLNSPETAIYSKGRTLYGLHLTRSAISRLGYAVLVEGYFDLAQLLQHGIAPVAASCGTALTQQHAQRLRRFTSKVVLSYDPDIAGQGAAARSCELLVAEGFDVNVALLPPGEDPDSFVRRHGRDSYLERLRMSRPYLEFLLDRTASEHDLGSDEGRRQFLSKMLTVAARIPDAAGRDQFGDRLAHKARITEEVVRAEIRKAAVARAPKITERELPSFGRIKQAERGLIWALMHEPEEALAALAELEEGDYQGLATRGVLEVARSLQDRPISAVPPALLERLNPVEAELVTSIAAGSASPAPAVDCARALRRLRYEREQAALQSEIDRLQRLGTGDAGTQIDRLWQQKKDLLHLIEALT